MTDGSPEDTGTYSRHRRRPTTATCRTTASMTTGWAQMSRASGRRTTEWGRFTTTENRESTKDITQLVAMGTDAGRRQQDDVQDDTLNRNSRWTLTYGRTMSSMNWRCRHHVLNCIAAAQHAVSSMSVLGTHVVAVLSVPLESTVNKASAYTLHVLISLKPWPFTSTKKTFIIIY